MKSETKYSHRILAMILCIIMLFFMCDDAIITLAKAFDSSTETVQQEETNEDIKARLLDQIMYDGWDPYSEDMTIDEFFALMELFDDGILPLNQISAYALTIGEEAEEDSRIPRTKFMFAGLEDYVRIDGSKDNNAPQEYDNLSNYEDDGSGGYYYPSGLDPYEAGYMRPPEDWTGIATDVNTKRAVLVSKDINAGNDSVASDVIQDMFAKYTGYYVKQVTIDGANINVLGMIEVGGRYIYYYLSAEDQNTQVSTTTLPDEAKFIIEYVPIEHTVSYIVELDGSDVTDVTTPEDVVFYGKNAHQDVSWADGIFGENRPNVTTDGAYSFDVTVPYGYELEIYIAIDMIPDIPYQNITPEKESFPVKIKHTGKKDDTYNSWLEAYRKYLYEARAISETDVDSFVSSHITKTVDPEHGTLSLKWSDEDDLDKPAHDSILERMAERINDFILHNDGYPLGTYPVYKYVTGFNIIPDSDKGPTEHTMLDTFYNHFVKADRTITAVLKKQDYLTFDVSKILQNSNGAGGRGSSATKDFAKKSLDFYDDDYEYHKNGGTRGAADDPLPHSADYPNLATADGWGWQNNLKDPTKNPFIHEAQKMWEADDGTYYYSWVFQTNSGSDDFYLDVLEVNGISIQIPYYPKYNWNNTYKERGEVEIADDSHPYYTEITLADGATFRLEFLMGWNGGSNQRHYRVTVTGARSNVVITGLNIMQYGTGAPEFVTYNLVGVYSDMDEHGQTEPAIEYYNKKAESAWVRKAQSNVVVDDKNTNEGINYTNGDAAHYGANIRFKITEGYGSPYYSWTNRHGDVIQDQASGNNPTISLEDVENLEEGKGGLINRKLDSQYIYEGNDGYYYIRVTTQNATDGTEYRMALLNIVARSVRFTVRYVPENDHGVGEEAWGGFLLHNENDANSGNDKLSRIAAEKVDIDLESMPRFDHNPEICRLWEMAKNETGEVPEEYQKILHQYDDNGVDFYDMISHPIASIATNYYGTIRPRSSNQKYVFVDWVVVDDNYNPVKDEEDKYIRFLGGAIDFTKYAGYAVKHVAFGNADTDIHVLRLMPVWEQIEQPFIYNVVLNWVDALGNIHAEDFSDYWNEVITETTIDENVYVYLNKDAAPLLDWIANHPTYTFWDDVNNAADGTPESEFQGIVSDYLKNVDGVDHNNIVDALTQKDFTDFEGNKHKGNSAFERMGKDIFIVNTNNGEISIWMYEDKGGLILHKDVQGETFISNDEFYFTVTDAKVKDDGGNGYTVPLEGEFKAYPGYEYDENGEPIERSDRDAYTVKFEDGKIVSINGDKNVTYFTLLSGEEIELYVPAGQYEVTELGSKSGGAYKVYVEYDTETDTDSYVHDPVAEKWTIPSGDLWLNGKGVSQVSAIVNFEVGDHNVVKTLIFCNQTMSLSLEKEVSGEEGTEIPEEYFEQEYTFRVSLRLPENTTPLVDDYDQYYFNLNIYSAADGSIVKESRIILLQGTRTSRDSEETVDPKDILWFGQFELRSGQRAAIVMTVLDKNGEIMDCDSIYYRIEEINTPEDFEERWNGQQNGSAGFGEGANEKVVNWYVGPPDPIEEYGYLVITEKDGKANESFLYKITDSNGNELIVSVKGGGQTVVYAPLGKYTITEISDWSWKYEDGVCAQSNDKTADVTIGSENKTPVNAVHADYSHKRNDKVWLGGENSEDNHFAGTSTANEEQESNSPKEEIALSVIFDDKKKKLSENE